MLAMPNATHPCPLGDLFRLYAGVENANKRLPAVRLTGNLCGIPLWALPAKTTAMAGAGGGE